MGMAHTLLKKNGYLGNKNDISCFNYSCQCCLGPMYPPGHVPTHTHARPGGVPTLAQASGDLGMCGAKVNYVHICYGN